MSLFWQANYEELPPGKKEEVDGWIGTNMFIAGELGLDPNEWWALVQKGYENPDDVSYLQKVEAYSSTDSIEDEVTNPRAMAVKLGGRKKDLASIPKVGEKKPEGSLSLSMLNFPRRT